MKKVFLFSGACVALSALLGCGLMKPGLGSLLNDEGDDNPWGTLDAIRADAVIPDYTVDDRRLVLEQARVLFEDVYVHKDLKKKDQGIHATAELNALEKRLSEISDEEFHNQMIRIFVTHGDLHMNYYLPKPHSCYSALLPLRLRRTYDDGQYRFRVESVGRSDEDFPAELKAKVDKLGLQVGDEVVSYNGQPTFRAVEARLGTSSGAAADPRERRALEQLTGRRGRLFFLPQESAVDLQVRGDDGELRSVSVPWLSKKNLDCLKPESEEETARNLAVAKRGKHNDRGYPEFSMKRAPLIADLLDTKEPDLKYRRVSTPSGELGHILLESFSPRKLRGQALFIEVARILRELQDTDGLVFDVRDNGGGNITIAERLVQFFTPKKPKLYGVRMLDSAFNRQLIQTHPWLENWKDAQPASPADGFLYGPAFSSDAQLQDMGQYYFKPLVVLMNASCYSSCDMFSSLIQDNDAGTIWGENHAQTGAGGANVWRHSELRMAEDSSLKELPGGQDMRVSFRQNVRPDGFLVENRGVRAERISQVTKEDLLHSDRRIFADIAKYMESRRQFYLSSLTTTVPEVFVIEVGDDSSSVEVKSSGVDSLRVTTQQTKTLPVTDGTTMLDLPEFKGVQSLHVEGLLEGKKTANIKRLLRKLGAYSPLGAGDIRGGQGAQNFAQHLELYNMQNADECWSVSGDKLVTNTEEKYSHNALCHASFFAEIAPGVQAKLSFQAAVQIEKDFDYIRVEVKPQGQPAKALPIRYNGEEAEALTGKIEATTFEVDLKEYAGQKVEVRVTFESDPGANDAGAQITALQLSAE